MGSVAEGNAMKGCCLGLAIGLLLWVLIFVGITGIWLVLR